MRFILRLFIPAHPIYFSHFFQNLFRFISYRLVIMHISTPFAIMRFTYSFMEVFPLFSFHLFFPISTNRKWRSPPPILVKLYFLSCYMLFANCFTFFFFPFPSLFYLLPCTCGFYQHTFFYNCTKYLPYLRI